MTTLSLDDIQAEAARRYGDLIVALPGGTVRFRPFLRLPGKARARFTAMEAEFRELVDADAPDTGRLLDLMRDLLAVTADRPQVFLSAVDGLDDGPAVVTILWERYQEATQPGEAARSVS